MKKTINKKRLPVMILAIVMMLGLMPVSLAAPTWTEVSTFAQFKTALQDAKVTHILLKNDIHVEKNGAEISEKKAELVIDGGGHKITAHSSNSKSDTIQLKKAGTLKNILVQNATIQVKNYFGFISVLESTKMSDVIITFENIEFSGPQLVFAEDSQVILRNGNFKITAGHSGSVDELVEAKHITLAGNINISKDEKGVDEIFRIERKGGGITVASGAVVNISLNQKNQKKTHSGFVHMQASGGYLRFEADSYFNYVGTSFFQQHKDLKQLYIGERAKVYIKTTGNFKGTYGIFMVNGIMTVDRNAVLDIICLSNSKGDPILEFEGKSTLTFNSPKEVFLYNSSTHKTNRGLAIGPEGCDRIEIFYGEIYSLEYWKMNTKPHDNLPAPTYDWRNPTKTVFTASCEVKSKKVTSAKTTGYTGATPFNTSTSVLKDINVIRINGGMATEHTITYLPGANGAGSRVDKAESGSTYIIKTEAESGVIRMWHFIESWNTKEDGTGTTYDIDDEIIAQEDLTLYAQWKPLF